MCQGLGCGWYSPWMGIRVPYLCHYGYCQSWNYADLLCPISDVLQGAVGASNSGLQGLDKSMPECSRAAQPFLISSCKCSKAGLHFNVPGIGFSSFPAKTSSKLGWTLRESQFKHGYSSESQVGGICLILGFTVHAGLGSGMDQGVGAKLWAAHEEGVYSRLCWRSWLQKDASLHHEGDWRWFGMMIPSQCYFPLARGKSCWEERIFIKSFWQVTSLQNYRTVWVGRGL